MMQIMNNIKSQRIFEKIMPLCLALFFVRTVFIGYKYLFFATFVPCFLYSVYVLFKQGVAIPRFKTLLLPVLVVLLFFVHFSPFSNVVKESANIALIVYFVAFADLFYVDNRQIILFKWIIRLVGAAGIIAIIRFVLSLFGVAVPLSNVLFEDNGYSLVRDNNFYSSFFIITLILSMWLFRLREISAISIFINVLISIINVGASVSRRAFVLYGLLLAVLMIVAVRQKEKYVKVLLYNFSILLAFVLCIIGLFVSSGGYSSDMSYEQKRKYYKMYTLIDKTMSFEEFDIKHQAAYYREHAKHIDSTNIFNTEYSINNKPWGYMLGQNDDSRFDFIEEEKNNYAIKLQRNVGYGEFQVWYTGRPIMYHKNVTYEITFAFRILTGSESPFYAGWWVNEGYGYQHNLPQIITPIDSVWNECKVSYKFREDHINSTCFLNTLSPGTIMEVKDISLTCDDTTGLPMYADQLSDSVIHSFFVKEGADTINYFTAPRTARWRYALELWQTRYTTQQKIFGQGFKYLEWYGEKFYNNPKRYDFPHNPIISSFLYSGIIGGIVYIIFLISSLWLYWKKRKTMGIFFIMYLCCMFFCMFSGSSHFSFPLFAFLSFLPFVEYGKQKNEVPEPAQ